MNTFVYLKSKKELWLDVPEPEPTSKYLNATDGNKWLEWNSRLHYSVSDELDALLVEGQLVKDGEFKLETKHEWCMALDDEWGAATKLPITRAISLPDKSKEVEVAKAWFKTLSVDTRQGIRWILGDLIGLLTDEDYVTAYNKAKRQNF